MTITNLKCVRCNKINCKKFYTCFHCNIYQCKECLDETNPLRLKYKIFKDDNIGVERTLYCVNHCTKTKKYCNDCGKSFQNLKRCKKCKTFFCSECNDRNTEDIYKLFVNSGIEYNNSIKKFSKNYCCKTCFELDYFYYNEVETLCNNCGEVFIDSSNQGDCPKCIIRMNVDIDCKYNNKRKDLQKKMRELLKKVDIKIIKKKISKEMEVEIKKNLFMDNNFITFTDWISDFEEGSNRSMLMYDICVARVLKNFGVDTDFNLPLFL